MKAFYFPGKVHVYILLLTSVDLLLYAVTHPNSKMLPLQVDYSIAVVQ